MFSLMNCQVNKKETSILSKVLDLDEGPNSSLGKNIYVKKYATMWNQSFCFSLVDLDISWKSWSSTIGIFNIIYW